jgi:hypothetical protein
MTDKNVCPPERNLQHRVRDAKKRQIASIIADRPTLLSVAVNLFRGNSFLAVDRSRKLSF